MNHVYLLQSLVKHKIIKNWKYDRTWTLLKVGHLRVELTTDRLDNCIPYFECYKAYRHKGILNKKELEECRMRVRNNLVMGNGTSTWLDVDD